MQKNRINIKYDVPVIEPLRYHVGLGARKGDEGRNKRSFTFRPISFRKKQNNVPQNSPQPMHSKFAHVLLIPEYENYLYEDNFPHDFQLHSRKQRNQ